MMSASTLRDARRLMIQAEELLVARPCVRAEIHVPLRSCLEAERQRPRTAPRRGPRPTDEQDPRRMCAECALSWHVTMATLQADRLLRAGAE